MQDSECCNILQSCLEDHEEQCDPSAISLQTNVMFSIPREEQRQLEAQGESSQRNQQSQEARTALSATATAHTVGVRGEC